MTLELGGKSAAIVLDDADLAASMEQFFGATLLNNGQICWLNSRVLAPRSRYNEIVDTITDLARSLKVGDPLDPETKVGPLVSKRQRERVEGYIAKGKSEGARMTTGGSRPAGFDRGWFLEPTIFADLDNNATVSREEIFGPLLALIPYSDEQEAVTIANDSVYGLGGSVCGHQISNERPISPAAFAQGQSGSTTTSTIPSLRSAASNKAEWVANLARKACTRSRPTKPSLCRPLRMPVNHRPRRCNRTGAKLISCHDRSK